MTHVLTIKFGKSGEEMEVHMLNPGQHFERFGGSSRGLVVGKTASIITRTKTVMQTDVERDISEPQFWEWMAKAINSKDGTFEAVIPIKG